MPSSRTVPLFLVLVVGPVVLTFFMGAGAVFDPPWLLLPLNLTFMCALPLLLAWLAFTAWRSSGAIPVLATGAGMLALAGTVGGSSILLYVRGPDAAMATHNIGVLFAGLILLASSPAGLSSALLRLRKQRTLPAAVAYGSVVLAVATLVWAVLQGFVPPFFLDGSGPTPLRDAVLVLAIMSFGTATISWWSSYGASRLPFVRWYATGLLLFTLGLMGVLLAQVPGDIVSWVGRGAQYLAGTYFLTAVWQATRDRGFAAALLHSALPYRPLVESASEGILVLDSDGTVFYCNEAARRLFGFGSGDTPGSSLLRLPLPPAAQQRLREQLAARSAGRQEMELANSTGRVFPAEVAIYLNPAATNKQQVWTIRDITDRRHREEELARYREHLEAEIRERTEALSASEQRFRALATGSPDHVVEMDRELRYTLVLNPQLGLKAEEMLGKTDAELVGAEDAARLAAIKRRVMETGEPFHLDTAIRSLSGDEEFFEGSYIPRRNAIGDIDGLIGYFRNVTQRRRTEEALRQSEQRFRSLFEGMNEGFALHEVILDSSGRPVDSRLLEVNPAWEIHTGIPRQRAVGRTLSEVLPGSMPLIERYGRVALGGDADHFEFYNAQLGRHLNVYSYSPAPRQFAVVFLDVTEIKRRALELEAANKELETFAYSISHDLRAPLRAIDGYVYLLMEQFEKQSDDEGRRMFESVRRNASRMAELIDDMLAFSRVGRTTIEPANVDMQKLVQEVIEEVNPDGRDVTFEVLPLPPARGDRAMLRQVWVNLLTNSIKFTAPRTTARIEVGGSAMGDRRAYYVKDNGVGFDMRFADKLFGVFQRLHTTGEFEGTGIGLAIVDRIVKRHGGTVQAKGKIGEGAEFRFVLPAEGPAPA